MNINKINSPFIRKSVTLLYQIPRLVNRIKNPTNDYSVFVNSVPKSGTHLLNQIVNALPTITNYYTFIASKPTIKFHERTDREILRRIQLISDKEIVTGHLFYKEKFFNKLRDRNCLMFFIFRNV